MKTSLSPLYVFLGILFASCLLISNIISIKLIQLGSFTITAGIIIFPVSYIVNDIISEIWGFKKARFVIWCGFIMNLLAIIVYAFSVSLTPSGFWNGQESFSMILQSTPRIALSSLAAYLAGSFVNSIIMSKMKIRSKGKNFPARAIISTLLGEGLDSLAFITLAFFGTVPLKVMLQMIILQVVIKTAYEIIVLPLTTLIVKAIRKYEQTESYDQDVSYNPFKVLQI